MPDQVMSEMLQHMKQSTKVLKSNLAKVQTGRANPTMVEDVTVEYYGTQTPLKQMATIASPDPNLLVVQPYDKTQIAEVEKAILSADLGLNPTNDGTVVRITVPRLTEERREELTRLIKEKGEEAKVALRNVRREANEKLEDMENDGDISEDDYHRYREDTDDAIHEYSDEVDKLVKAKNEQLRTI